MTNLHGKESDIFYYEQKHPYYIDPFLDQEVIMYEQINAMIETYGADHQF